MFVLPALIYIYAWIYTIQHNHHMHAVNSSTAYVLWTFNVDVWHHSQSYIPILNMLDKQF